MKITLIKLALANKPLEELANKHYKNFYVALKLAELKKITSEKTDFYLNQEKSLILQYAGKDDQGNPKVNAQGQISFDSAENAQKFSTELDNLKNTEVEIGDQITIHIPDDIKENQDTLSPNEIIQLGDLIHFETQDN